MFYLYNTSENNRKHFSTTIVLMFSFYLGELNVNLGFALKPYMLVITLFFILSIKRIYFYKLMNHEIAMLTFYLFYCLTGIFSEFPVESLRLIGAIIIGLFSYHILKYFFSRIRMSSLERTITIVGI